MNKIFYFSTLSAVAATSSASAHDNVMMSSLEHGLWHVLTGAVPLLFGMLIAVGILRYLHHSLNSATQKISGFPFFIAKKKSSEQQSV